MATKRNPYPNQPYPLGVLEYKLSKVDFRELKKVDKRAMLDYGESELMYDIPRILGGGLMANLGHARGGSALILAQSILKHGLEGSVISVDTFKGRVRPYERAMELIKLRGLHDLIDLRNGTTSVVGEELLREGYEFKFVFIDANHSYEHVLEDLELWTQMLVPGGFVAFHDTNQEFSHRVLEDRVLNNPIWRERTELHVCRIRVFEKTR
jgi:predicted O-methyltransferase YrrM